MPVHIKLYGPKADRFESIKDDLCETLGYEPSNPEVVGILMAGFGTGSAPDESGALTPRRSGN